MRPGQDLEVEPFERRLEIGVIGADPVTAAIIDLIIAKAVLIGAVVIRIKSMSGRQGRLDKSLSDCGTFLEDFHRQGPAFPPVFIFRPGEIFKFSEVGQHIVIAPAFTALLRPIIVILRLAAHIDHAVNKRRTAQALALGN